MGLPDAPKQVVHHVRESTMGLPDAPASTLDGSMQVEANGRARGAYLHAMVKVRVRVLDGVG